MAERHVNYFALQAACAKSGCPLCRIIEERVARYIDGMLFEHISDRVFRAQYREAGGFCREHSQQLLSYRDGLAVAILGRDTLEDALSDFRRRKMRVHKRECPACIEKRDMEREFLTFMAEASDTAEEDRELRDFVRASDGLCAGHYADLVRLCGKKIPRWLSSFHEERFQSLLERTIQFIDCSAWGNQEAFKALSSADKVVWKELAEALRGAQANAQRRF